MTIQMMIKNAGVNSPVFLIKNFIYLLTKLNIYCKIMLNKINANDRRKSSSLSTVCIR